MLHILVLCPYINIFSLSLSLSPCLTKKAPTSPADVGHRLLQKLCYDHVDILVLLLPARAKEAQVLSSLHTRLLHLGAQPVHGQGEVHGRVEELER